MPSVKKMAVMHALALTVPSARMIFRRKGAGDLYIIRENQNMGSDSEDRCLRRNDVLVQVYVTLMNRGVELDFEVGL